MKKILGAVVCTLTVFIGAIYVGENYQTENNLTNGIVNPAGNEDHPEY